MADNDSVVSNTGVAEGEVTTGEITEDEDTEDTILGDEILGDGAEGEVAPPVSEITSASELTVEVVELIKLSKAQPKGQKAVGDVVWGGQDQDQVLADLLEATTTWFNNYVDRAETVKHTDNGISIRFSNLDMNGRKVVETIVQGLRGTRMAAIAGWMKDRKSRGL